MTNLFILESNIMFCISFCFLQRSSHGKEDAKIMSLVIVTSSGKGDADRLFRLLSLALVPKSSIQRKPRNAFYLGCSVFSSISETPLCFLSIYLSTFQLLFQIDKKYFHSQTSSYNVPEVVEKQLQI